MSVKTQLFVGQLFVGLLVLFGGCELNQGSPDVSDLVPLDPLDVNESNSPDTPGGLTGPLDTGADEEDTSEGGELPPVVGCGWATGTWNVKDCADGEFIISMLPIGGCNIQMDATVPLFVGAIGRIHNSGISITLASLEQCHGYFDGKELVGACDAGGGVCGFSAAPQPVAE